MPTRYDLVYFLFAPIVLPWVGWRWAKRGKYSESGPGMLGRRLPDAETAKAFEGGSIWIHAVSVGEVAAARTLVPELQNRYRDLPIVISTITETGQASARTTIPEADAVIYFPLDVSANVSRFLDVYRPRIVIILEAEIWPNFLTMARARGASVFQVNGKMSDRSFPRYAKLRRLVRPIFDAFDGFCVQTDLDAERYEGLGVPAEKIKVTGNVKFDLAVPVLNELQRMELRANWGLTSDQPVVLAGSTHEGEEELILDAYREVRSAIPDCSLVIAPRHPERFDLVHELVKVAGFNVAKATELESGLRLDQSKAPSDVIVLNKMGVLSRSYGIADVAIVAGSFGAVGGHNLLEPAAHAVPVVYGPNMRSQREIAHLFTSAQAGLPTEGDVLGRRLIELLQDKELRQREGAKCLQVLLRNQGSARRSLASIAEWSAKADR